MALKMGEQFSLVLALFFLRLLREKHKWGANCSIKKGREEGIRGSLQRGACLKGGKLDGSFCVIQRREVSFQRNEGGLFQSSVLKREEE